MLSYLVVSSSWQPHELYVPARFLCTWNCPGKHTGCWYCKVASVMSDLIDGSQPGSTVSGILQARTLEWVAISFSSAWKWKVKVKSCPTLCDPRDCSLPGSCVHGIFQARVLEWGAIAFSKAYWSGLPFSSSGDPLDPGIKSESPVSHALQVDSLPLCYREAPYIYKPEPNFRQSFQE